MIQKGYEPYIRARLGTAAHFCEVVVLKLRTVPIAGGGAVLDCVAAPGSRWASTGYGLSLSHTLSLSSSLSLSLSLERLARAGPQQVKRIYLKAKARIRR